MVKSGCDFLKYKSRGTELANTLIRKKIMKRSFLGALLILCLMVMQGCAVVGGIFKAGMVWGILLVVILIVGIIALVTRSKK